jgi:hypothetical protein
VTLLAIMVGLSALAVLFLVLSSLSYRRFRNTVPEIRSADDLTRLRSHATLQMYLSLPAHPALTLGGIAIVWLLGWLYFGALGWLDLLLYGVLPVIVVFVLASIGESPADQSKEMQVADASLAPERDRIVDVWINRLLPKW